MAQRARARRTPLLLAAGELPVAAPGQMLDLHAADILPGQLLVSPGVEGPHALPSLAAGKDDLIDAGGEIPLNQGLLGQVADLILMKTVPREDLPLEGADQAEDRFHQGGFAGAVFSHDAEIVADIHFKVNVLQDGLSLISEGEIPAAEKGHQKASFPHDSDLSGCLPLGGKVARSAG